MTDAARALEDGIDAIGLSISPATQALMLRHCDLVREANETLNLTRITEPAAMVSDHVLDALALLAALRDAPLPIRDEARLLDVGTGAGFPGIPLALAKPGWRMLLVDSRRKKAAFLLHAARRLGIPNVEVLDARAAEVVRIRPDLEWSFDLVTARAVAKQAAVLEEVSPLVRPGGLVVHFKGPGMTEDERRAARESARRLGFETLPDLPTPQDGRDRRFVVDRAGVGPDTRS